MKILILSDDFPPYALGGAGVMAFRLAKEFVRQGNEVLVISTVREKEKEGVMRLEGMIIHILCANYNERWRSYYSLCNPFILKKIKIILAEFSPDIVHAHNVHTYLSYASLLLAKKYADKVFMTAHDIMSFYPGTFTEFINPKDFSIPSVFNYKVSFLTLFKKFRLRYNPFRNILIRYCLSRITRVIAVSKALREALSQNGIKNASVIHNGINVSEWNISPSEAEEFRKTYGLAESKIILFQGRLSGAKGGDLILQAMAILANDNPSAKLLVIGKKDAYAERMRKRAKDLGIEEKIIFSGWLDEAMMRRAYASSDVVVIPSVCFDSFPNGNLEAFASRKPVVATCFGGSSEIVEDGKNGFIVNPFDVQSLSDRLSGLLSDGEKVQRLGEEGYRLAVEKFSIDEKSKEYLAFFVEN